MFKADTINGLTHFSLTREHICSLMVRTCLRGFRSRFWRMAEGVWLYCKCKQVSCTALTPTEIHFRNICADKRTCTAAQATHTQADSTDRGLIGVSVSGWADLNCPRGLVPGRETDGGLGSPMYFPRFPLTRSYCDSRSANPTSTPFTPAHTHSCNSYSSSATQRPCFLTLYKLSGALGWVNFALCARPQRAATHSSSIQAYYWRKFIGLFI